MADTERRAALQRGEWFGRWQENPPDVLPAAEAWHRRDDGYVFYLITWWGDLPAGFQEFRFTDAHETAFGVVMSRGDGTEQEAYLEADELVLAFQLLEEEDAGNDLDD